MGDLFEQQNFPWGFPSNHAIDLEMIIININNIFFKFFCCYNNVTDTI